MAVSHQWFIRWSEPAALFADVTDAHARVNNWDAAHAARTSNESASITSGGDVVTDTKRHKYTLRAYKDPSRKSKSGPSKPASVALALWLATLGVARPQPTPTPADTDTPPFSTLYKWKHVDFEFPTPWHREYAIQSRKYIPENVMPLGIEVWGSRVWVTLPSWRRGVPATLATVPRAGGLASPRLEPYPDWSYHRAFQNGNNCSGLISVFRVSADPCGRLWVIDSGQIDLQDSPKQVCPPSVAVFDLATDRLLARYPIPRRLVPQDSLYANIVVDTRAERCSDLHLYIADTWRFGLLVFRESDRAFWRFSNPLFYPDPLASNFTLHGLNFQWPDGVFGLALSPVERYADRVLYFNSLASYREFFVPTSVLRDSARVNSSGTRFRLLGESRGPAGQVSATAVDRRGVMFYGLVMRDSVGCWNTRTPYRARAQGVVAANRETVVFPNDIKVDQEPRQSVWVITNRLPMFQAGRIDPDDYNYRILYADTRAAVGGTVCDISDSRPPSDSSLRETMPYPDY